MFPDPKNSTEKLPNSEQCEEADPHPHPPREVVNRQVRQSARAGPGKVWMTDRGHLYNDRCICNKSLFFSSFPVCRQNQALIIILHFWLFLTVLVLLPPPTVCTHLDFCSSSSVIYQSLQTPPYIVFPAVLSSISGVELGSIVLVVTVSSHVFPVSRMELTVTQVVCVLILSPSVIWHCCQLSPIPSNVQTPS